MFDYNQAFDRNKGWLTREEQDALKNATVAIAGVGGAGGNQALDLARLGVGGFKIADPDCYELTNFNRQAGANMATLGRRKVDVIRDMILAINPEAKVEVFPDGISSANIDRFLDSIQVVMDGVDFYQMPIKVMLFDKSRAKGLTVVTCCPLGFGATLIVFTPQGMSFRNYFDLSETDTPEDVSLKFLAGLSPSFLPLCYVNKKEAFDPKAKRGGSVSPGLTLVGSLSVTEAAKVLTGKGRLFPAPHVWEIDMLTRRTRISYFAFGMKSPWQRLKRAVLSKVMRPKASSTPQ
ncbi:MAG: ThiF family adenylyltransferase [Candidatus Omnitrophica bacterium]|nr:ThiF family adenylyltransferase [Candidatus Omnitrophota bacterium]